MIPIAHVGGIPVEETLGSFGPALLLGLGVVWALATREALIVLDNCEHVLDACATFGRPAAARSVRA